LRVAGGRHPNGIVGSGEAAVGPCAADLHLFAAQLVEAERRAPAVAEFTRGVDRGVLGGNQSEVDPVGSGKGPGDVAVFADRIAFPREIGAPGLEDLIEDFQVPLDGGVGGVESRRDR